MADLQKCCSREEDVKVFNCPLRDPELLQKRRKFVAALESGLGAIIASSATAQIK